MAATGGIGGSSCVERGLRPRSQRLRTFSGVSAPSRVVKSTIEIANRSPWALVEALIERVVNSAARRWAMTGSTVRTRMPVLRQIRMRNERVADGDALVIDGLIRRRGFSTAASCGEESGEIGTVDEDKLARRWVVGVGNRVDEQAFVIRINDVKKLVGTLFGPSATRAGHH